MTTFVSRCLFLKKSIRGMITGFTRKRGDGVEQTGVHAKMEASATKGRGGCSPMQSRTARTIQFQLLNLNDTFFPS